MIFLSSFSYSISRTLLIMRVDFSGWGDSIGSAVYGFSSSQVLFVLSFGRKSTLLQDVSFGVPLLLLFGLERGNSIVGFHQNLCSWAQQAHLEWVLVAVLLVLCFSGSAKSMCFWTPPALEDGLLLKLSRMFLCEMALLEELLGSGSSGLSILANFFPFI